MPPSDIVGKVAEEILRRANVSEEEANRELIRVEKVDEYVDREREQRRRMKQQGQSLLEKVKESRNTGGKSKEKKLVRVERVDLTDEEEIEEDPQPEKPVKPASEARFQERAKSNNESINASKVEKSSRMEKANKTLTSEDDKSSYERRFGKTNEVNTTQESNTSAVKKDENNLDFNINKTGQALAITPPPFFAKFLKVTAKEREMIDFLHNYTDSNGTLGGRVLNITQQKNGNEKEQHNMTQRLNIAFAQAHIDKIHARDKRDHKEGGLRDTLQPLIAKLLGPHNDSEDLKGSFNLSNILGKLTDGSQNFVTKDNKQTSVQDSTALLVKFLQQGSRYRSDAPKNDTSMHTDRDYVKVVGAKLGIHKSVQQTPLDGAVNLKKTLLELANHINLTRKDNYSTTTSQSQEKKADLTILKLLLNKSTWQDFSVFNLSRVLKEIAGSSLKVKRHENADDLGSSRAESNLKIVRPVADRLENSKPMLVLNTGRKPSNSLKSEEALAPKNDSVNVTSVDMGSRENHALLSNGFGSGEPGDEGSRRFV